MSGWTGIDFSKFGPDEPIRHSRQDAQTSALERRELGLLPRCRHLLNLHIGRVPRRPGYLVTAAECYTA
jgi:hypothetical protein